MCGAENLVSVLLWLFPQVGHTNTAPPARNHASHRSSTLQLDTIVGVHCVLWGVW